MFGISRGQRRSAALDEKLSQILSRRAQIPALETLTVALGTAEIPQDLRNCVIAIDSSVFLKLAAHEKSADVIDYINTQHANGVILPGQSVQEFWNNRYNAVPSLARQLKASFDTFAKHMDELDGEYGGYKEKFKSLISEFEIDHGHVFDERTISKTFGMLDALRAKALVPFVDRERFQVLAVHRQNTKTPPGFRDDRGNDGDFFVWLDVLRGMQLLADEKNESDSLVFVTDDKKDDWSRDGMPHPILSAELKAICGSKLCIVDLAKFIGLVQKSME